MRFLLPEYRIVRTHISEFAIQRRTWWLPIWRDYGERTFGYPEIAEDFAYENYSRKPKAQPFPLPYAKYLGRLV